MNTGLSHESLNQLVPWYANGTLSAEEHAAVEEHLKSCSACQSELQWLREVGAAMTELAEETPPMRSSFAKTLAAVEDWEQSKRPARVWWFAGWLDAIWNPSVPVARFALAAQFALIAALGVFLISHRGAAPTFNTLSGSGESTSGSARLTISFAPNATVEGIGQILTAIGANIVSGPSASGIYVIELPNRAERDSEVQTVIEKLRGNQAIRFVERQP